MLPPHLHRVALLPAFALLIAPAALAQSAPQSGDFQSIVQFANDARESGNADEAIRDYTRALVLRPDWAEGWWDLGTTQYAASQYSGAIASLTRLVVLAPDSADAWSMLGLSEFETKDYLASLASLEKAQKLGGSRDPEIARVSSYHLALLFIRSGQFEKASPPLDNGESASPQIKIAYALCVLRIPLLPSEIDPSQDALIHTVADTWSGPNAQTQLLEQYPNIPWLHYSYGLKLTSESQLSEALQQLKIETGLSPASSLPWIQISNLELRLKHLQEAVAAAQKAVSLSPNLPEAHTALAKAFTAAGKSQQAAVQARIVTRLAPPAPVRDPRMIALYGVRSPSTVPEGASAWESAMQDYSEGRYPQTIASLKSWVERNPSDGTAWAVLGLSEFALKDYDNARIHLQRGINLGVKGSTQSIQLARDRLALLLIRNHQFDEASSLLRPVAGQLPLADQIQLTLGLALLRIPRLPEDLDAIQQRLTQSAGAIVQLLFASRYAEAFSGFQKLLARYPDTPWLHYAYGNALDSLSQYDAAKAQMQAETRLSPHSPLPWIQIAAISLAQHNPADALSAAQTATRIAPGSAEAHYQLGRAWLESEDAQKSIAELKTADALRPNNPEIHFALARAYSKANQPEKAAAERTAFTQLKALENQNSLNMQQGESILQTNTQ